MTKGINRRKRRVRDKEFEGFVRDIFVVSPVLSAPSAVTAFVISV